MKKDTIFFESTKIEPMTNREALTQIYTALQERGYNAIDQMVGYLTSGDPSYITSYANARNIILKMDRDEILEEILCSYLGIER